MTRENFEAATVKIFCTLLANPDLDVVTVETLSEQSVAYANTLNDALTHDFTLMCQGGERPRV